MADFSPFFEAYGRPVTPERADAKLVKRYAGVVPPALIEFWLHYGFGGYAKGLVWVVNPAGVEDALAEWLPARNKTAVPVVRTSFGNIIYWQASAFTFLDVHYDKAFSAGGDVEILFDGYLIDPKSRKSVLQEPKFKQALKALGELDSSEMYSFKLPLVMGGADDLKNLAKVKMREQLAVLAEAHGK